MNFNSHDDAENYARNKYGSMASVISGCFFHPRNWEMFWDAVSDAQGTASNSPGFALGVDLPYLHDNFERPVETYDYASFYLDFDTEFELDERMPLPEFIDYLKDANAIACQMYPEHASKLKAYLSRAIERISNLHKAHEDWKKRRSGIV